MIDTNKYATTGRPFSLLRGTGIWPDLQAACLLLASSNPGLIRSASLSFPASVRSADSAEAIRRFAEEHCLSADIELTGRSIVIRLRRRSTGDKE